MQFILEQPAQFASDIQIIREVIKAQQEQFGSDINQVNTVLLDVQDVLSEDERFLEAVADGTPS
jgi:hypothetical protein